MRILQLCKKVPYPLKDGESIAIHFLSRGLTDLGCEVSLMAINTKKHFVRYHNVPPELQHYKEIKTSFLDNTISAVAAFTNLFTNESYNIARFDSDDFRALLVKQLQQNEYDIVQLETLYLAPYIDTIKAHSNAKVSMRSHNLEHEIWSNLSRGATNPFKRWYYGLCAKRLKHYESTVLPKYDILLPITDLDDKKYAEAGYTGVSCITQVGLELKEYFSIPVPFGKSIKLGYIGSLDWKPNVEGIDWFFDTCWKELKVSFPQIQFYLAGRNMPEKYLNIKDDRVVIKGEVDDARLFIHDLDVLVVPLFSGSGIRVKILEGMAMAKAVVSTPKGLEGIPVVDRQHALVFNDLSELKAGLQFLFQDNQHCKLIQSSGQALVTEQFGYKSIAAKVLATYQDKLSA